MSILLYSIIFLTPLAVLASGWYCHEKWSLFLATLPRP